MPRTLLSEVNLQCLRVNGAPQGYSPASGRLACKSNAGHLRLASRRGNVAPMEHQCCTDGASMLRPWSTSVATMLHRWSINVAPMEHQCCTAAHKDFLGEEGKDRSFLLFFWRAWGGFSAWQPGATGASFPWGLRAAPSSRVSPPKT